MSGREIPEIRRRELMALLGAGSVLSLAGCGGDGGDGAANGEDGGDGDGGDEDTPTESPEPDTSEELQAVEVPEDANCPVCDMKSANFPEWNAQVAHEDDTREFFCTSGCATTYYVEPGRFAETDADIGGLWVTGFESGEFIDGMAAYYALETDSDRIDDPMRLNPAPFGDRPDAVAYVDEVDYLSTDDIVELSAFDRNLATQYRARFLEE